MGMNEGRRRRLKYVRVVEHCSPACSKFVAAPREISDGVHRGHARGADPALQRAPARRSDAARHGATSSSPLQGPSGGGGGDSAYSHLNGLHLFPQLSTLR